MTETGTITRVGFEAALSAARDEGETRGYPGLAAPLDGSLRGKISEVWETVEQALRTAYVDGRDQVQPTLDAAINQAEQLIKTAGTRAKDVHQALLAKVQTYLSRLVDAALSQVRHTVQIGSVQLELDALDISQSISLTGSIKASFSEIIALTSVGQLTVSASYRASAS